MRFFVLFLFFCLFSCNSIENANKEKIKNQNKRKVYIHRKSDQVHYPPAQVLLQVRDPYPWELESIGRFPRITKEMFRCKGDGGNPPKEKVGVKGVFLHDCTGHSLPVRNGKEFIYPILLELLNYVQSKLDSLVVITCGHRCPAHNAYADPSVYQMNSKHMIGAEVDFYVQGFEDKPEEVIELIQQYFQDTPTYRGSPEYTQFFHLTGLKLDVKMPPLCNKEILIKLYAKGEGRDLDTDHPHPYISVQVRFDREKSEKVIYSWEQAFNGYMRY